MLVKGGRKSAPRWLVKAQRRTRRGLSQRQFKGYYLLTRTHATSPQLDS